MARRSRTDLAASLAEEYELTKRQGETLLNGLVGLITKHLRKGERIRIAGLGILQVSSVITTTRTWPPDFKRPNSTSSASGFLMCSWITRAIGRAPISSS
jgi:hypothetical protein